MYSVSFSLRLQRQFNYYLPAVTESHTNASSTKLHDLQRS